MSVPVINPHRLTLRASVDGTTLRAFVCAIGRGPCASGSFYSHFDRLLPQMVETGRALSVGLCARPIFVNSRCACGMSQAGDCPACAHGGVS